MLLRVATLLLTSCVLAWSPVVPAANVKSLVVPVALKNYRLSYANGEPRFINSAANESTRIDDYITIDYQMTLLSNEGNGMCDSEDGLELCPIKAKKHPRIWKIRDSVRTVQFVDDNEQCLTVGLHDSISDSYDAAKVECEDGNLKQLFYLNVDHGPTDEPTLNASNIDYATEIEKEKFRSQEFPFKASVTQLEG